MQKVLILIMALVASTNCAPLNSLQKQKMPANRLEFRLAYEEAGPGLQAAKVVTSGSVVYLEDKVQLGDQHVARADVIKMENESHVLLLLTEQGRDKLAVVTHQNKGKRLAILINGEVMIAPVIRHAIEGGRAVISPGVCAKLDAEHIVEIINQSLSSD